MSKEKLKNLCTIHPWTTMCVQTSHACSPRPHLGGFQAASRFCKLASCNYKPAEERGWITYFLLPHRQHWRLQIEDDSHTWPRFRLESNAPVPRVTAYLCAITMSEKIVHLTLRLSSPPTRSSFSIIVLSLPRQKANTCANQEDGEKISPC